MKLIITNGNANSSKCIKQRYNNIVIETSIKENTQNIIEIGKNHKVNKRYTSNHELRTEEENQVNKNNTTINDKSIDLKLRERIDVTTSHKLKRGEKITIPDECTEFLICLEWDYSTIRDNIELDTSIFMIDIQDKTDENNFIFYNNPKSICESIKLSSEHNSILRKAFNETIMCDIKKIPMSIKKIAITVSIDEAYIKKRSFFNIKNCNLKIVNVINNKEIVNYNFNENLSSETAIVIAEIYRYKEKWKISPIGQGFIGGLESLCSNFGIETNQ